MDEKSFTNYNYRSC